EVGVAEAAPPAACDRGFLTDGDEIRQQLPRLVVVDGRAGRDGGRQVGAGRAVPTRAFAAPAGRGLEVVLVPEVAEGRLPGVAAERDRAAATAVAAIRATAGNVGLAPERRGSATAVAGLDEDRDPVEEHRSDCRIRSTRPRSVDPGGRLTRRRNRGPPSRRRPPSKPT